MFDPTDPQDPPPHTTTDYHHQHQDLFFSDNSHFAPLTDHLHDMHVDKMQSNHLDNNTTNKNNNNIHNEMNFAHFNDQTPNSTTDLLTLLHLPRYPFTPPTTTTTNALGFVGVLNPDNPTGSGSSTLSYDPTLMSFDPFHPNLPPQPSPLLKDLMFQTLPHAGFGGTHQTRLDVNTGSSSNNTNSLYGVGAGGVLDEGDHIINGIYQDQDHNMNSCNGILEFTMGNVCLGDGSKEGNKCPKSFVTERQRRQNFNDKYQHLRSLVPSPTKVDRASIVGDAINYIQELKRTVGELKILVEKKRISKERVLKRLKNEDTPTPNCSNGDNNNTHVQATDGSGFPLKPDPDEAFSGSGPTQFRSSWLQRKCKDTEVDVRIVDDEVTIKLVQRKKMNCLLSVSRTLDELHLDLSHVAGGHVGDYYSYLFNTKICEGSSVYASAIANKLVEVVERQYAAASVSITPCSSF